MAQSIRKSINFKNRVSPHEKINRDLTDIFKI